LLHEARGRAIVVEPNELVGSFRKPRVIVTGHAHVVFEPGTRPLNRLNHYFVRMIFLISPVFRFVRWRRAFPGARARRRSRETW
jgi:hypothetical protein